MEQEKQGPFSYPFSMKSTKIQGTFKVTISLIPGVILVPIRELALQIQALAQKISKFTKINIEFFIGGTMVKEDYQKI